MSAGTIALTNNSANVTGTGTAFTTDLKVGDFVVAIVGGVTYTLGVKAITSATALTLITAYGGPTASGNAWTAVPNVTLVGIAAQMAADVSKAIRGLNLDKANWQQVFSGTGTITVTLPDGSTYSGPAWSSITTSLSNKADKVSGAVPVTQGGTGGTTQATARSGLGLGTASTVNTGAAVGTVRLIGDPATGIGSVYDYSTAFMVMSTRGTTTFFPGSGQGTIINIPLINNSAYSSRWIGDSSGRAFFQNFANSVLSDAFEICLIGKSVTVDANGFIKKSSPIVDIYTDGTFTLNDDSKDAEVVREGVGVYKINNVLGMNSDPAWGGIDGGFEVPKDRNGNPLIWLDYQVSADGSVTVKTYHRTHPSAPVFARNEIAGVAEGDPIDIPEGRFVSVRVQMSKNEADDPLPVPLENLEQGESAS